MDSMVSTAIVIALVSCLSATATRSAAAGVAAVDGRCLECVALFDVIDELAGNESTAAHTISVLQHDCNKIFKVNSTLGKLCDSLAKDSVNLLAGLEKQIESIAWDSQADCALFGLCKVPCCLDQSKPEGVHLAIGATSDVMTVMWTTLEPSSVSEVRLGTSPESLSTVVQGANHTYTNFGWIGALHRVTLTGLIHDTQYYYTVGDGVTRSETFSFRTLSAAAGTDEVPLRVASIGDMGYSALSDDTVASIAKMVDNGTIDLVIHNGDISYADGEQHHWDVFMRKIEPIASKVPYMVTPGNHEIWANWTAYKNRFAMPGHSNTWMDNMFYSYDIGPIHFNAMNTESILDIADMTQDQLNWMALDLAKSKNSTWHIAYGHRPLYCSNRGGNDVPGGNKILQYLVEDILLDNHVDLVLQAHVHDYERTYPIVKDQPAKLSYDNPGAPVYIVNGAAGQRERNDNPPGGKPWEPSPRVGSQDISFGVMTVTAGKIHWEQFVSSNLTTIDTFTITK